MIDPVQANARECTFASEEYQVRCNRKVHVPRRTRITGAGAGARWFCAVAGGAAAYFVSAETTTPTSIDPNSPVDLESYAVRRDSPLACRLEQASDLRTLHTKPLTPSWLELRS